MTARASTCVREMSRARRATWVREIVILLAAAPSVAAQGLGGPTALPGSTREAGLAGAGVALLGDAGALFANPAAIAAIRRVAVEASYAPDPGGAASGSGADALRIGPVTWGVGALTLQQPAGVSTAPSDVLGVSGLVARFGLLAVGSSLKYVEQTTDGVTTTAGAADVGAAIALFDIFAFGASVQNLGGSFLERCTRVGFTMNYVDPQGTARLLTTLEGQWLAGVKPVLVGGVEGGVVARGIGLVARVGVRGEATPTPAQPFTLGAGLELGGLHLDYAYQGYAAPNVPRHRVGMRWTP